MRNLKLTALRCLTSTLVAMLTLAGPGAAKTCEEAVPMTAGDTWRDPGGGSSDACFDIDVATAGLLLIELSTPDPTTSPPRLLERPGGSAGAYLAKDSAAGFLVWFAEAGTYRMDVAAGDAAATLPAYKLHTAFLPREQGFREIPGEQPDRTVTCTSVWTLEENPGELENPPELKENPGELENPPELKENPGELENPPEVTVTCTSTWTLKENPGELENPPEGQTTYKENPGELENPPEVTALPGESGLDGAVYDLALFSREMRTALGDLCTRGEVDDHGDSLLCATALGPGGAQGKIDNPWNDDADVFRFDLALPRTVEISTHGATDTAGELYDRFGNRLESAGDGGEDGNFRMVRTLSPGVYFVRVVGEGYAAGPYSLTVRTSLR